MNGKAPIVVLFVSFLLAGLGPAHAQTQTVDTELRLESDPPLAEGDTWAGEPLQGEVHVSVCWDEPGGTDPEQDPLVVTADATAVAWIVIDVSPGSHEVTLPQGPTTGPGCANSVTFTVSLTEDGLQPDATETVEVTISADAGDAMASTFNPPPDNATQFTVATVPASGLPDNDDDNETDENDEDGDPGTPAPAAALTIVLVAAVVALMRRRRGGAIGPRR